MVSAVIVSAVRTAIGTARKGSLANTTPEHLAKSIVLGVVERSGIDPALIDDVVFAESLQGGGAIARHAAVEAGLIRAGGMAVNRHCAGSLASVGVAAGAIIAGMEDFIIAGGVNSSSLMPMMSQRTPPSMDYPKFWLPPTHPDSPEAPYMDMSITVGWNTAKEVGISREDMDKWALRSNERALAASDAGQFKNEIVPVQAMAPDGSWFTFEVDEHPRRGTTLEQMADLKLIHPEIEGFSITAGNSSGINDAASAMLVTHADAAKAQGLEVQARIHGWTSIGIDPRITGLAVPDAVNKLLARAKVAQSDVKLWEINEAFAAVTMAAMEEFKLPHEVVNVHGGACALGHPIGASGARIVVTLLGALRKRSLKKGVAALCIGGGEATALAVELL